MMRRRRREEWERAIFGKLINLQKRLNLKKRR